MKALLNSSFTDIVLLSVQQCCLQFSFLFFSFFLIFFCCYLSSYVVDTMVYHCILYNKLLIFQIKNYQTSQSTVIFVVVLSALCLYYSCIFPMQFFNSLRIKPYFISWNTLQLCLLSGKTSCQCLSTKCVICKSTCLEITSSWSNHTSPPSMAATFLATRLMAVLHPSRYPVFHGRDTPI